MGPGSLTAGVQVLPAEAGTHSVPDRTAGAGRAQAASPQLRLQIPALGGHVIRCSYASRPAWEPVPRSNGGGGPLCSFVRGALAKVSEGPVGPWKSSTDNDEDIRSLPNPFDPVPLPEGGRGGGRGEQFSRSGHMHHILNQVVTAPSQPHDRSYHRDPTPQ